MSYCSTIKDTILNEPYKSACCRKAFLCGIASSKWKFNDEISFTLEKDEYCEFVNPLILEFFGKEATISKPARGGRCREVKFFSKSALKYISSIASGEGFYNQRCQSCTQAFFRGVFFASGRISASRSVSSCRAASLRLTARLYSC